ncbi:hypothetical protein E2C01_041496 [Portunus trituberculatus]|uniref:Uncharacterized protein n=1 Tax=Portunus trituberculatus TaxID=210409 RepID=A0A5B7FJE4_PORTR|nr:hypothetical protein [Portunus trituberculatus]
MSGGLLHTQNMSGGVSHKAPMLGDQTHVPCVGVGICSSAPMLGGHPLLRSGFDHMDPGVSVLGGLSLIQEASVEAGQPSPVPGGSGVGQGLLAPMPVGHPFFAAGTHEDDEKEVPPINNLVFSQRKQYLVMVLDLVRALIFLLPERVSRFLLVAQSFLEDRARMVSLWMSLLGHLAFLERLIPGSQVCSQSLQWCLEKHWMAASDTARGRVSPSQLCLEDLFWWMDPGDILWWCEDNSVSLRPRFVLGWHNALADVLSCECVRSEWTLHPVVCRQVFQVWSAPQVDLFATALNHQLPLYVSPLQDPGAWKEDAYAFPLEGLDQNAFPPFSRMRRVLLWIRGAACIHVSLITLCWHQADWFPLLLSLLVNHPRVLPPWASLLRQPHRHLFHKSPGALHLHAWRLSSASSEREAFCRGLLDLWPVRSDSPLPEFIRQSGPSSVVGKRMPDQPPTSVEVPQERRGGLGLEVYKGDTWEDVTDRSEGRTSTIRAEEDTDADDPNVDDLDMEFEEMVVDDPVSILVLFIFCYLFFTDVRGERTLVQGNRKAIRKKK